MKQIFNKMTVLLLAAVLAFSEAGCRQSPAFMKYYESNYAPESVTVSVLQESTEQNLETETEEPPPEVPEEEPTEEPEEPETETDTPEQSEQPHETQEEETEQPEAPAAAESEATDDENSGVESQPDEQTEQTAESDSPALMGETGTGGETETEDEGGTETDGETAETGTDQTNGTTENGEDEEGEGRSEGTEGEGGSEEPSGVIAQGQAAVLVQMLGGEDILMGADGSTLSAMSAYFPASELNGTVSLGGGSTLDAALISTLEAQPALCFLDSPSSAVSDLGIECVVLDFSSVDSILTSVERVRSALNSPYADRMAQAYNSFYSNVCSRVAGCGAARTVYISQWDYGAGLCIGAEGEWFVEISGLAVADRCGGTPLNRLLQIANVENSVLSAGGGRNWYVNSLLTDGYTVNWWDSTRFDIQLGDGSAVTLVNGLGGAGYPAVIAANSSVKAQIESAAASGNNIWTVCSPEGLITTGASIASVITGSYEVYVNPQGLGSWTNGSPECILEPLWAGWRIQGACSESEVRQGISDFYQTFYRCSLSDGQLNQILAGY